MLVHEYKLKLTPAKQAAIDEAIRVVQFVRNKCLRLWMDEQGVGVNDLQIACSRLAHEFAFAARLNAQAPQAAAARAWAAIGRFYANCKAQRPGKKGYPRFQHDCRSVEYKVTGWKLDPDGRHLAFTDGCSIGRVKLLGSRELANFPVEQIKRSRRIRQADGYYAQFVLQMERRVTHMPTSQVVGIDVGLHVYCMDSDGQAIANLRFIHHVEQLVRRRHQRLSRKSLHHKQEKKPKQKYAARQRAKHSKYRPVTPSGPRPAVSAQTSPAASSPRGSAQAPVPPPSMASQPPPRPRPQRQSANWHKARRILAKTYLKLQRQREDVALKQANALVSSHDLLALEDLQIRNLVKNRHLAKAISDAGWARFRHWVEYYGRVQQVPVIAVPPQYTSQVCSGCGELARKSLSMRTHISLHCGLILDRDHNAAVVILEAGVVRAIEQGVWNVPTQWVLWSGRGSGIGNGSRSGTVGHTGTSRVGTAGLLRAPAGRCESVGCPGWRNQASPGFLRAECQNPAESRLRRHRRSDTRAGCVVGRREMSLRRRSV